MKPVSTACLCLLLLMPIRALQAAPLEIVDVGAPDINCVFYSDCTATVTDLVDEFPVPEAEGRGRLQSRTHEPGDPGTPGAGLYVYEYRVDLGEAAGLTAQVCVRSLAIDFGPIASLDYDGDGDAEDIYVVTSGGLGSVAPSSADQTGATVTFTFSPAVCPGSRPGDGESSLFFGLASANPPTDDTAVAAFTADAGNATLDTKVPAKSDDPGDEPVPCEVGPADTSVVIPIDPTTPACRCVQDRIARSDTHCAFVDPDLFAVWRFRSPVVLGEPFRIEWLVVSTTEQGTKPALRVLPPRDFTRVDEPADGDTGSTRALDRAWLRPHQPGHHTIGLRFRHPQGVETSEIRFPIRVRRR